MKASATALIRDVQDTGYAVNALLTTTGEGSFPHVFSPKKLNPPGTDHSKCSKRIGKTTVDLFKTTGYFLSDGNYENT